MTISLRAKGDWELTRAWIARLRDAKLFDQLDHWGQMGVDALSAATPVRTGRAAASWHYRIMRTSKHTRIEWYSTDEIMGNTPVVVLLQYGHATGTGGYVRGRDFINPAMEPVFAEIASEFVARMV